eukprot:scaffold3587_cov109-Isochrysis_galbana.AAC.4
MGVTASSQEAVLSPKSCGGSIGTNPIRGGRPFIPPGTALPGPAEPLRLSREALRPAAGTGDCGCTASDVAASGAARRRVQAYGWAPAASARTPRRKTETSVGWMWKIISFSLAEKTRRASRASSRDRCSDADGASLGAASTAAGDALATPALSAAPVIGGGRCNCRCGLVWWKWRAL